MDFHSPAGSCRKDAGAQVVEKGEFDMPAIIYQVDAFTNKAFRGNPAGVCILKQPGNETLMQLVAREMNLSETAFLCETEDGTVRPRHAGKCPHPI